MDADFLNETRLSNFFYVRDKTETRLNLTFRARPRQDRESWCLFLRDRDENHLLMKKMIEYWLNFFWKLHIQIRTRQWQDWAKFQANETRPRQDCLKNFHQRRDRNETTSKIFYATRTKLRVSRPRGDRDSIKLRFASLLVITLTHHSPTSGKVMIYLFAAIGAVREWKDLSKWYFWASLGLPGG